MFAESGVGGSLLSILNLNLLGDIFILEKVMKRQWGSRRDTTNCHVQCGLIRNQRPKIH